jgi:hypothetical protein
MFNVDKPQLQEGIWAANHTVGFSIISTGRISLQQPVDYANKE